MTTINQFVAALNALVIGGVSTVFPCPPTSLNDGDLPAQWVQQPTMTHDALTFSNYGGWPSFTGKLIVAVKPCALATGDENWTALLDMMEAVDTALAGASGIGKGKITWSTQGVTIELGGVAYWATVTDIEGHG